MSSTPVEDQGGLASEERVEKQQRTVLAGVTESIGFRSKMEDTHVVELEFAPTIKDRTARSLFAVFDGHGGVDGASLARDMMGKTLEESLLAGNNSEDALRSTFLDIDKGIDASGFPYGCTAAAVLLEGDTLITANVGDTRVLLIKSDSGVGVAERMSRDHTLQDPLEMERVVKTGAEVDQGRIYIGGSGGINVARALGDKYFGNSVSPEPTVSKRVLSSGKYRLVIECDGVWQAVEDENVPGVISGKSPKEASEALVEKANDARVYDNFTALVVDVEVF